MTSEIIAATIGASAALLVSLLKDGLFEYIKHQSQERKRNSDLYRAYAEPLASAGSSLFWRLHEIFSKPERGAYLSGSEPETEYADYKRTSTAYRIGCMFAWIFALRRELSHLSAPSDDKTQELQNALVDFETQFADGPHVELFILDKLSDLWGINVAEGARLSAAMAVERVLKRCLHQNKAASPIELSKPKQKALVKELAATLVQKLGLPAIDSRKLSATTEDCVHGISFREVWIYRDIQNAIGDLMLVETGSSGRRYDLISYHRFEACIKLYDQQTGDPFRLHQSNLYFGKIEKLVVDLDVTGSNNLDVRVAQLKKVLEKLSNLILLLDSANASRKLITQATRKAAKSYV